MAIGSFLRGGGGMGGRGLPRHANATSARGWHRQRRVTAKDSCRVVSGAHSVLYVTYSASNLQLRSSATNRKLRQIVADFAGAERRQRDRAPLRSGSRSGQSSLSPTYRLELLYQRTYAHEPFNCSLHVPAGAGCGEFTREEMKRTFGHDMALHRPPNVPRRLNVGFWVMALWMMRRESAARCDRGAFVWYLEDDVYLPGSWSRFLGRYDTAPDAEDVDLLVAQPPYQLQAADLAVVRGDAQNPQLSIPRPTLARRLPVTNEDLYAKAPLYTWRMRDRLANAVADALRRGARARGVPRADRVSRAAAGPALPLAGHGGGGRRRTLRRKLAGRVEPRAGPRRGRHRRSELDGVPWLDGAAAGAGRLQAAPQGPAADAPPRQGPDHRQLGHGAQANGPNGCQALMARVTVAKG